VDARCTFPRKERARSQAPAAGSARSQLEQQFVRADQASWAGQPVVVAVAAASNGGQWGEGKGRAGQGRAGQAGTEWALDGH
jgi:hypothetical protein